jgi:hypothetical protein
MLVLRRLKSRVCEEGSFQPCVSGTSFVSSQEAFSAQTVDKV